jgi:hypothetical protein
VADHSTEAEAADAGTSIAAKAATAAMRQVDRRAVERGMAGH